MENKNQWEAGGDCTECRRKSYCNKPCKANKLRVSNVVYQTTRSAIAKAAVGMMRNKK